jgi:hypothetical protein
MRRPWPGLLLVPACAAPPPDDTTVEEEPALAWSFAVVADPHVTDRGEHLARLEVALAWIDEHADDRGLDLTLVAGDVAWGDGYDATVADLMGSRVPVVPIIGDNEIQVGEEGVWADAFAPLYDALPASLPGFRRPDDDEPWLQRFAFDHEGTRVIGVDWSPRVIDPILGEMAEVNPGTLDWLVAELDTADDLRADGVVLLSHQPMAVVPGGFFLDDWAVLSDALAPYVDRIGLNLGGHLHLDAEHTVDELGYDVLLTDATWDDVVTLRLIDVWQTSTATTYETELVVVPFER